MNQEKNAKVDLEKASNMEDTFWKEKSMTKRNCDGDKTTAYFHKLAKIKQSSRKIFMREIEDTMTSDPNLITEHIVNHFTTMLSSCNSLQDNQLIEETISYLIYDHSNALLIMMPSHEEIKAVVFNMNKHGSPDPDGFGAMFFQSYWELQAKRSLILLCNSSL